jgi:predicted enzyme related to lactoylglutathione lyase
MSHTPFTSLDHFQLAMPKGEEETARRFFRDLFGMAEVPKPAALAQRGGCWFVSGPVQIHVGVDPNFKPATKAHPAIRCRNYRDLLEKLRDAGVSVREDFEIPGTTRCHISDPWGNCIELISE